MRMSSSRCTLVIVLLFLFILLCCQKGSRFLLEAIRKNAASVVIMQKDPKTRIHRNIRYAVEGENLIITVDYWEIGRGIRKNWLKVITIPVYNLSGAGTELKEVSGIGVMSYDSGKTKGSPVKKLDPHQVILHTKNGRETIELAVYSRGAGPQSGDDPNRWVVPDATPERKNLSKVSIYVPSKERGWNIVDAVQQAAGD